MAPSKASMEVGFTESMADMQVAKIFGNFKKFRYTSKLDLGKNPQHARSLYEAYPNVSAYIKGSKAPTAFWEKFQEKLELQKEGDGKLHTRYGIVHYFASKR